MKTGDLVRLKPEESPRNGREIGTILKWDAYVGSMGAEPMVEVLWNTGARGWILLERVEVIRD